MRRVYILTNFSSYLKSYSPIIVVGEQLKMFAGNPNYEVVLIASEGWDPPEDSVFSNVLTKRITQVPVSNEAALDATFEADIEQLATELDAIIEPDSVVITHDLIFLPDYVKHNLAARKVAEKKPDVRWLHWVHSATSPLSLIQERERYGDQYKELLKNKFPNSIIAFPNAYSIPRVARNFDYEEDEIFEVPHASDPTEGMQPIVKRLYEDHKLYQSDVLMVYPLRLDRGKNAEMNIHLIGALKRLGQHAQLVFCDFHSTGDDKLTYREDLKKLAAREDVSDEVIFLSEQDEAAQLEVSHQVVLDLFTLSNVFMLPSKSETYSLIAQEAMMRGNFCILNHDFAPMRQIYGENAIYRQFSSNIAFDGHDGEIKTNYSPSIEQYFDDLARNLGYWLIHDKTIKAKTWVRKCRNPHYIFTEYMEKLLNAAS